MKSEIIREAILLKKVIEFYYDGGRRTVEPHCLGISTAGNVALRGFQTSGHSLSGGIPDWRFFDLEKVKNLVVSNLTFRTTRPGYRKGDRGMDSIFTEL